MILVIGGLLAAACTDGDDGTSSSETDVASNTSSSTGPPDTAPPDTAPSDTAPLGTESPGTAPPATVSTSTRSPTARADDETLAAIDAALAAGPEGCDPLDTARCLLPFPSDATTVADDTTVTGRRVAFPDDAMPTNAAGAPIDPAAWNQNDGFSANSTVLTHVADLDPAASNLPTWTDLGASLGADASVVMVDVGTGERIPLWAEPDVQAAVPSERLLVIHPAIGLQPATTYAVGLQHLVDTTGAAIEASPAFRVYRDHLATGIPVIERRRDEMERAFAALAVGGIERTDLQLAWTFTTVSTESLHDAVLHMRGETLAGLGTAAPEFAITSVTENPREGLARLVEGTFSVPNWLAGDGGPGAALDDPDGAGGPEPPRLNGVVQAPFACGIAADVFAGDEPARAVMYGHGLLGSHLEVTAGNIVDMSNEHNALYCATKWAGFSDDDVGTAVTALQDLSNFPALVDGMLQGFMHQLVLGRLMLADNGLVSEPEFQRADGSALFDNSTIVYDGNSQGGIMGLALIGLSTDIRRATLGVVGMNYSVLLPRSVDFEAYEQILIPSYPSALDRALGIAAIQMLWDRGEGAGYVRHIVDDPLRGTPPKDVLMHVAFGDWQVSELTAMIAARTMGIGIHRPVTADDRSREVEPGWGIDSIDGGDTSGLVIFDSGSDPIPIEQTAPRTSRDPHEDPRADPDVRRQKAAFLFDGELIDVCGAAPCTADVS